MLGLNRVIFLGVRLKSIWQRSSRNKKKPRAQTLVVVDDAGREVGEKLMIR